MIWKWHPSLIREVTRPTNSSPAPAAKVTPRRLASSSTSAITAKVSPLTLLPPRATGVRGRFLLTPDCGSTRKGPTPQNSMRPGRMISNRILPPLSSLSSLSQTLGLELRCGRPASFVAWPFSNHGTRVDTTTSISLRSSTGPHIP